MCRVLDYIKRRKSAEHSVHCISGSWLWMFYDHMSLAPASLTLWTVSPNNPSSPELAVDLATAPEKFETQWNRMASAKRQFSTATFLPMTEDQRRSTAALRGSHSYF